MSRQVKQPDKPDQKKKPPRRRLVPPEVSTARKYKAWELRLMNNRMTYAEITKELNKLFPDFPLKSDHQAVEKMIKEAEKEYAAAQKDRVEEIRAEAAISLNWVRQEAAAAWVKSRDQIVDAEYDDDGHLEKVVVTAGNAQYLRRITESTEAITKIMGVQAPSKHELTGKNGAPLVPASLDFKALSPYLSDDDLTTLQQAADIIERAQRDLAAAVETGS